MKLKCINYDLFGSDISIDYHWGKIFLNEFGSYYSRHRINHINNIKTLIPAIQDKFKPINSIELCKIKKHTVSDIDYENTEVFMILKKELCIAVSYSVIDILYGSEINKSEIDELLTMINNHKIINHQSKKFS